MKDETTLPVYYEPSLKDKFFEMIHKLMDIKSLYNGMPFCKMSFGNVHFTRGIDRELTYDIPSGKWEVDLIAEDILKELERYNLMEYVKVFEKIIEKI